MNTTNIKYRDKQKRLDKFKKDLKKNATKSELLLKQKLTELGIKFHFQKSYYNEGFSCIVDFLIKYQSVKLVIEIDGGYHFTPEQIKKDKMRENWLIKNRRCTIIRFTNEMIENDIDNCIIMIAKQFSKLTSFEGKTGGIMKAIMDKHKIPYRLRLKRITRDLIDTNLPGSPF